MRPKNALKTIECPDCSHVRASRYESKKKPGVFFWQCGMCGEFFNDADGEPGERFGYSEDETAWVIHAVEQCATTNDLRTLLRRHGASEPGINRRLRVITDEGFVEIADDGTLHITPAGKKLADDYGAWRGHPAAPNGSAHI